MRQPDEAVLVDMLLYGRRIRDRMKAVTYEEFVEDSDLQLAITYLIQVVGEAANRSGERLRASYPQIPWEDLPPLVATLEAIVPQATDES